MRVNTETCKAYSIPLSVAVFLHAFLLWFLLPKPATIIDDDLLADNPKKIESYLYRPTEKQSDVEKTKPETNPETRAVPQRKAPEEPEIIAAETEVENTPPLPADSYEQPPELHSEVLTSHQESQSSPTVIQTADKPKATFNPFKGLLEQNAKQDRELSVPIQSGQYGYSVFQELPEPVPESIVRKSAEQIRRENTTIVGNETIEKRDGYCYQETDLSFINDEFGKTASVSACGESSKDKYFREFMKGVAKRR